MFDYRTELVRRFFENLEITPGDRNQEDEVYDMEFLVPDSTKPYNYVHLTELDCIDYGGVALDLFRLGYYSVLPMFNNIGVRPGHCLLRAIKYKQRGSFGAHHDIDFATKVIASVKDGVVRLNESDPFYGTQAALIKPEIFPQTHKFNPDNAEYSLVFFANAHYSTRLAGGLTVGDYLNELYYNV